MTTPETIVPADRLRTFVRAIFETAGLSHDDAATMADALVWADLRGLEPHGVSKLPLWIERLRRGGTRAGARPTVVAETATTAVLDAQTACGHLAGTAAMALAVRKACQYHVAAVVIRNSGSFGAMGYYPLIAVRAGQIGLAITNSMPLLAPTGGAARLLGNQAYAIGCPAGRHSPLLLDTSNSATSWGRVKLARERGETLSPGLALDADGRPTLDPDAALEGLLLPAAGHKGYGLALMWEVLTGILAGLAFGPDVGRPEDVATPNQIAGFMLTIDPAAFLPPDRLTARVDALIDQVHAVPKARGVDRVYAPGERGSLLAAQREQHGIPLSPRRVAELEGLAEAHGIPTPW